MNGIMGIDPNNDNSTVDIEYYYDDINEIYEEYLNLIKELEIYILIQCNQKTTPIPIEMVK